MHETTDANMNDESFFTLEGIGVVRSPFHECEGMPLQAVAAQEVEGTVELAPRFAPGLRDLEGFSHVHLVTWLHRAPRDGRLEVIPFLDEVARGVFATRSPRRPNPIGLSVVRLLAVEGARLSIRGVDLLDGTPVLDLKPYVPGFDCIAAERVGWLEARAADVHVRRADGRLAAAGMEEAGPPSLARPPQREPGL
jgi:tRNA-Thr(GGU) m(6)t(6)A37 methyltransferase TsaA